MSGISYSRTDNYFSQIFFADSSGQVIYTEGNLGVLHNWGLSLSANGHLASWWTVTAQGVLNRKIMDGVIEVKSREKIMQFNASLSNQFQFKKGWSAELSGFYVSRSRVDLQELLDPAGQVSLGVSKSVLKTKGTLRAGIRDIFYTQIMQGYTDLAGATETFRLCRDSRVATLSFTYRFGKPLKGARRTEGPSDEVKRVGTGG